MANDGRTIILSGNSRYIEHIDSQINHFHYSSDSNDGKEEIPLTALSMLDNEVRSRLDGGAEPKQVLLPVKAAMEAEVVIPFSSVVEFNDRYGCDIKPAAWSRWIKGVGNFSYDSRELSAYITAFSKLK